YSGKREPVVTGIRRISKPGLRVYAKSKDMPRILGGLGVAIVSTPQGVMTAADAKRANVGGEILCYVWGWMSRIGRAPVSIPDGVQLTIDGARVTVKGPKGELSRELHPDMELVRENGTLEVRRPTEALKHKQLHGLTRTLVANMVEGVTKGYEKT